MNNCALKDKWSQIYYFFKKRKLPDPHSPSADAPPTCSPLTLPSCHPATRFDYAVDGEQGGRPLSSDDHRNFIIIFLLAAGSGRHKLDLAFPPPKFGRRMPRSAHGDQIWLCSKKKKYLDLWSRGPIQPRPAISSHPAAGFGW